MVLSINIGIFWNKLAPNFALDCLYETCPNFCIQVRPLNYINIGKCEICDSFKLGARWCVRRKDSFPVLTERVK